MVLKLNLCYRIFPTVYKFPLAPFCFNLNNTPSCQTLSNALDISRNTPQKILSSKNLKHVLKICFAVWYYLFIILLMDQNNICSFPLSECIPSSCKLIHYARNCYLKLICIALQKYNLKYLRNSLLKSKAFQEVSYRWKKVFIIDQYVLLLTDVSFSFLLIFS